LYIEIYEHTPEHTHTHTYEHKKHKHTNTQTQAHTNAAADTAFESADAFKETGLGETGMALLPELSLEEVRMLTLALNELEVSNFFLAEKQLEFFVLTLA
jgi:hypothetical protein